VKKSVVENSPASTASLKKDAPESAFKDKLSIDAILELLRSCPEWTAISAENASERLPLLKKSIRAIAQYDEPLILAAVEKYCRESTDKFGSTNLDMLSKVYILNRFLFAVPEVEPNVNKTKVFGGWVGPPENRSDGGTNDMLWPLHETSSGLEIIGKLRGYFGPDYEAVEEFKYFFVTYGLRTDPKWSG
jgi:hypothetical protein